MGGWSNDNRDTIEWLGNIKAKELISNKVKTTDITSDNITASQNLQTYNFLVDFMSENTPANNINFESDFVSTTSNITAIDITSTGSIYANNGNIETNYIKTYGGYYLGQGVIKHTITATDVTNGYFTENWNDSTMGNLDAITIIEVDSTSDNCYFNAKDGTDGHDCRVAWNGSTFTITAQVGTFVEGQNIIMVLTFE